MKIKSLHIEAFGRWLQRDFTFGDGFNFLFGPNEAGKSTLMQFISALFFGLGSLRDKRLSERPRERFSPWHSGQYGGSIRFDWEGRALKLERSFGKTKRLDRIRLLDDVSGELLELSSACEPGEQLFKISLSEFINTFFTAQLAPVVSDEGEIKRRLSAALAGSEATRSVDDMLKQVEALKKTLASERSERSLLKRLKEDERTLSESLDLALADDRAMAELATEIAELADELNDQSGELAALERLREGRKRLAETEHLQEALHLLERRAAAEEMRETLENQLGTSAELAKAESLMDLQSILEVWAELEGALKKSRELRDAQSTALETALAGGKSAARRLILHELQKRQLDLAKQIERLDDSKSRAEADYFAGRRARERELAEHKMARLQLQANRRELAQTHSLLEQRREQAALLRAELERLDMREKKLVEQLQGARHESQAADEERRRLESERGRVQASLNLSAQWEAAWDKNERRGRWATLGFVLAPLSALSFFLLKLFFSSQWLWLLPVLALLVIGLALWLRIKLIEERKQLRWRRDETEKSMERLKSLALDFAQQEKRQAWCARQFELFDSEQLGLQAERERCRRDQAALEQTLDELERASAAADLAMSAEATDEPTLEARILVLEEALAETDFVLPTELALEETQLATTREGLRQALALEGLADEEALSLAVEESERLDTAIAQQRSLVSELEKRLADEGERRTLLQAELRGKSLAALRVDSLELAREDFAQLRANFLHLRELKQEVERLDEKAELLLAGSETSQAVLRIAANRRWLAEHGQELSELGQTQSPEQDARREQLAARLPELKERLWHKQEQQRRLQSSAQIPAQLERQLALNRAALREVEGERDALELAGRWISESEQELRLSFGPAINKSFSELLANLTGSTAEQARISQNLGISLEDGPSRLSRESDYYSAGKIDQMYLALRLSIIENVYMQDIKLPLFFDDSFVQFDGERSRAAINFLCRYAEERGVQIFFASCHRALLDLLADCGETFHCIDLYEREGQG